MKKKFKIFLFLSLVLYATGILFVIPRPVSAAASIPSDSDNSPNYFKSPVTGFNPSSNPDLFVKGVVKGIWSAGGAYSYIIGGDPNNPSGIQQTNDSYSTYYDHCETTTRLDEGFIDQNNQISSTGFDAPSGYYCSNGAFVAIAVITVTTSTLPSGVVGNSYSATVTYTYNSTNPLTATWTGLPDGLRGQGTGYNPNIISGIIPTSGDNHLTISGTLTKAGTYNIGLNIVDQFGATTTVQFSLLVMTNTYIPGQKISLSTSSPLALSYPAGTTDVLFTSFIITSGVKDITVNNLTVKGVASSGSWTGSNSISNIRICQADATSTTGFTCLGSISALVPDSTNPTFGSGLITFGSPAIIQSSVSNVLPLFIYADFGSTTSGKFALGISSMQYTETDNGLIGVAPADVLGYTQSATSAASVTPSPTPNPASISNKAALGWIDSVSSSGVISGWALDPDHPNQSIQVEIFFDAPSGQSPIYVPTDQVRSDVNRAMNATGTHGFNLSIPAKFADGKSHKVYAYALDPDTQSTFPLNGTGKIFTLGSSSIVTRHPRASLVKGPDGTVYFLGDVVRYPFPSAEVFLSWGNKFSDIISANSADLAMPLGPIAQMKQ